jgi:hypothetical protein
MFFYVVSSVLESIDFKILFNCKFKIANVVKYRIFVRTNERVNMDATKRPSKDAGRFSSTKKGVGGGKGGLVGNRAGGYEPLDFEETKLGSHHAMLGLLVVLLLVCIAILGTTIWLVKNENDEPNSRVFDDSFHPILVPWTVGDWDSVLIQFIASVKLSVKQYVYDSVVAFNTDIFVPSGYRLPTFTTIWGSPSAPIPDVGIIGVFDYTEPYSSWAGDDTLMTGSMRYPLIISDFGHGHIYTVHSRSRMLRVNPSLDVSDMDMMLERLSGGSAFLFAKFALLVDVDGNFIPYSGDPPVTQMIKGMFYQFIFGDGTSYEDGASIDLTVFATSLTNLINTYGTSAPQITQLLSRLSDLEAILGGLLRLSGPDPLNLVPWLPLMIAHQASQRDGCMEYFNLYSLDASSEEFADAKMILDAKEREAISMGLQMAAFFTGFERVVNILDKLMVPPFFAGDDYAIPLAVETANLDNIDAMLRNWWMEHVVVFRDWNLACALADKRTMYESETAMTEGCGFLATSIGKIFLDFDTLMRRRGFYSYTDTL